MRGARRHGLTLAELLLGLTISALLMTAVAVALKAALQSYTDNERIAAATQVGRTILTRLAREVRTADQLQATASSLTITPPANDAGIQQVQYERAGDGSLYYRQTVGGQTTSQVLAGPESDPRLQTFSVTAVAGTDPQGNPCVKSVSVRLELLSGNQPLAMTASAAPRRFQAY